MGRKMGSNKKKEASQKGRAVQPQKQQIKGFDKRQCRYCGSYSIGADFRNQIKYCLDCNKTWSTDGSQLTLEEASGTGLDTQQRKALILDTLQKAQEHKTKEE